MNTFKKVAIIGVIAGSVSLVPGAAHAGTNQEVLRQYSVDPKKTHVVVDSAMTREQALGDNVVSADVASQHQKMKPYLRVVPVVYWGYEASAKVHVGQIVVHKDLVSDTNQLFLRMFMMKFPLQSVIPQSKFGYNDEASMQANNTSNYRPEAGSEHGKGAAFDLNPRVNPFDITAFNPSVPVQPAGATYKPGVKGTITMNSELRKLWTSYNYEWGGNWGNPNADPATDFYKTGYFDYQHFQLNYLRYQNLDLPDGIS